MVRFVTQEYKLQPPDRGWRCQVGKYENRSKLRESSKNKNASASTVLNSLLDHLWSTQHLSKLSTPSSPTADIFYFDFLVLGLSLNKGHGLIDQWWFPTFLAPGISFMEDNFSMDWELVGGWFGEDSSTLHLLCCCWSGRRWSSGTMQVLESGCKYRWNFLTCCSPPALQPSSRGWWPRLWTALQNISVPSRSRPRESYFHRPHLLFTFSSLISYQRSSSYPAYCQHEKPQL